ncbi:ABC transporter substrate-binding protein [Agrococcus jejuensis]|uniref:Amino acid/amide ABC transporter substrate-binding protein, HAAT family n=1 Tax=Agrococcus jejuensis TaxID=399736 RepID=A0A1G8BIA6_9MICO|nr:ABC transporter substrate-binding protein [Agrococcus jejuensis]SDH32861.1 amino acid/amide ABC transporter substrate-binding protein, HAAT family [Agrococcus jejuensis]
MKAFLRSRSRRAALLAASTAGIVLLAACSTGGGDNGSGSGDGASDDTLVVGTILPQTGNLAFLGPPEFAGVDLAVADLEAADYPFTIEQVDTDSGDTTTDIALQSASQLIDAGADVAIGAASSGVSFTFIDQFVDAGVVQISPANTSPDFSDYDDDGFYWRTAPSDVLQGRVLGNLMVNNGAANVAFLYINDPYGIGLAENAGAAVEAGGGAVVASVPYNPGDTNFSSQVSEILAAGPDAVGILAFEETANIVPELISTQGYPANQVYFVDGNLSNSYEFPAGTLEGTQGTLPGNPADDTFQSRLLEVDSSLTDFSYAPESYDAVILAALAAAQGGSPDAETIRDNLQSVSEGGTKCTDVAECLALIADGEDIDYDGVSGPIEFDENGDPTEAYIGIYQYGADNRYTLLNTEFGSLTE